MRKAGPSKSRGLPPEPMVRLIEWKRLLLDQQNPRLPETMVQASRQKILTYLYERCALLELCRSMLKNGFFRHEPLIV
jgi:hypothetical protein